MQQFVVHYEKGRSKLDLRMATVCQCLCVDVCVCVYVCVFLSVSVLD